MMSSGTPRDPSALLERADVSGDARQDQHFLIDDRILDRFPEYASDLDVSHVLEIGAGTGALTDRLLRIADQVTAIEQDDQLVAFLRTEFQSALESGQLRLVHGDALEVSLPPYTAALGNLPYGISSPILFRLLPRRKPVIAMVQREFADRMVASPGTDAYGRLSVTAQHYAAIEILEPVPPTAFVPQPPVESAIIKTTPRSPSYEITSEDAFFDLVKAVFTQRRKTMRNALRNTTHISDITEVDVFLGELDEELLAKRPERVSPAEFARLTELAIRRDHR